MEFLKELSLRNYPLYIFGWICLAGTVYSFYMIGTSQVQINGSNAWIKPAKFFLSAVIFVWTIAWFIGYLPKTTNVSWYYWLVIAVFAFELFYITLKASQGQLSHFNVSNSFNSLLFSLMGLAISMMTLATLYIAYLFFTLQLPQLSTAYLWGIRLGLLLFVIFAFEGGLMGAKMAHTVGAPDGTPGIKFLNWSMTHGDLRVAHFVGMHALQVLPFLGYYLVHSSKGIIIIGIVYLALSLVVLIQALAGKPLWNQSKGAYNQPSQVTSTKME